MTGDANLQNFSGMENLIGNAANDSFVVSAALTSINTGDGTNSVTINNGGAITSAITGGANVDTIIFNGTGTAGSVNTAAGNDLLTIVDNSSVSGLINGGADSDSVTITGINVSIILGTDVDNVETINAGGGTNTIIGENNAGNTWVVDASNTVNDGTDTITFSNFSVLTAGTGGDNFTVNVSGIDTIHGNSGNDDITLDTVGLITTLNGNGGTDSLAITNGNSTWSITDSVNNNGDVFVTGTPATTTAFNSVETLIGSSVGIDSIDLTSFGAAIIQLINYQNFDSIIGNALGTLQGIDGQQHDWTITSGNVGSVLTGGNYNIV